MRLKHTVGILCLAATIGCSDTAGPGGQKGTRSPSVSISPSSSTLEAIGDTVRLVAQVRDGTGALVPDAAVIWTSSNPAIASVDGSGLLRALGKGDVNVRADALGASSTAALTVTGTAVVATVGPSGGTVTHPAGATLQIPAGALASATSVRIELAAVADPVEARASESFQFRLTGTGGALLARQGTAGQSAPAPLYATIVLPLTKQVSAAGELVARVNLAGQELPRYAADAALEAGGAAVRFSVPLVRESFPLDAVALLLGSLGGCADKYELRPASSEDVEWDTTTPPVILIHGWQSDRGSCPMWQSFQADSFGVPVFEALTAAGLRGRVNYWRYTYPTFNSIDAAARDLAAELETRFPRRTDVVIVAHSMGGLVARAAVELHGAGDRVHRVITLGTPHRGTPLAVAGAWVNLTPFLSFGSQGVKDLQPESVNGFLAHLNASSLAARRSVYHTIAGDREGGACTSKCGLYEAGGRLLGMMGLPNDGIVPVASATWAGTDPEGRSSELRAGLNHDALTTESAVLQRVAALVQAALPPVVPPAPAAALAVSSRGGHSCALRSTGEAYCWGYNERGQLGNGNTFTSATPVRVAGGRAFREIAAGGYHTCALTSAGAAYCWGWNRYGQLGSGSTEDSHVPVPVGGGHSFVQISAGELYTCGLTAGGTVHCWGWNDAGQLGIGVADGASPEIPHPLPERVVGGVSFSRLEAGYTQTCAIAAGGTAYCWGGNGQGQVGDGSSGGSRPGPVPVAGGHSFVSITAGAGYTCGVTSDSKAYCWGRNFDGQLGIGSADDVAHGTPAAVAGSFTLVSAGNGTTCAVGTDVRVYCWGAYGRGTLGLPQAPDLCNGYGCSARPVRTSLTATARAVSGSRSGSGMHVCSVSDANEIYCWGSGIRGQLGNGGFSDSAAPVRVTIP
jgi:alpha-tubulin suppressor-like RCC1 family protein/pimeloyl-ACP methyl ester carboxylesterase